MSIDEWLWGGGYSKGRFINDTLRISGHFPAFSAIAPIQIVPCANCGEQVPTDDHFALNGLPYHRLCLPAEGGA